MQRQRERERDRLLGVGVDGLIIEGVLNGRKVENLCSR